MAAYSLVLVLLDQIEQVDSEDLENHAEMVSIWSFVDEGIQELDYVAVISAELLVRIILELRSCRLLRGSS